MAPRTVFSQVFLALFFFLLVSVVEPAASENKLYIQAPASIKFNADVTSISSSDVTDVVRELLGFTVPFGSSWPGAKSTSPFNLPKAALLVDIVTSGDLSLNDLLGTHSYMLAKNEDLSTIHKMLSCSFDSEIKSVQDMALFDASQIQTFVADHSGSLKDLNLGEYDELIQNEIEALAINTSNPAVAAFLSELNIILKITQQIAASSPSHGLYAFSINGLKDVPSDDQKSAVIILINALTKIQDNIMSAYNNQAVLITEVIDVNLVRKTRSLLETSTEAPSPDIANEYNLAQQYTSAYQNTFAAILFLVVVLTLTILTVSLVMWNMDPGRDSIIYRMTTHRVKMD